MTTKSDSGSVLVVQYDRPSPGRELAAMELVSRALDYFEKAQRGGAITSYDAVSLSANAGHLHGFILVKAPQEKLDAIRHSDEFVDLMYEGYLFLQGVSITDGVTGDKLRERMGRTAKLFTRSNGLDVIK